MLPWTAPSTLPRSGSHGVLAHQQRGLAGHRGGEGLVQLSSTCLPALSATATWQARRPSAQRRGLCHARLQRGRITHPMITFPLMEWLMPRLSLWSLPGASSRRTFNRAQRAQRRLLRLGESPDPGDIESLVGSVATQRAQVVAALQIPYHDSTIISTAGQEETIRTMFERLDRALMRLSHLYALPEPQVPPAQQAIAAATDQHRSTRTPSQRVHPRARLAPGMQALSTARIPDEELSTASVPATTGEPRTIRTPGHTRHPATMPLELLQ